MPKRMFSGSTRGRTVRRRLFKTRTRRSRFARRRGRRTNSYTTRSSNANSFGFRSKRISRRAWARKLWDSTLQKSHYRSVAASLETINSVGNATIVQSYVAQAMDNTLGVFWTTAGGAIDVDGGTMPLFTDDIVIRGGKVGVHLSNQDPQATDNLNVDVYLYELPNNGTFNGTGLGTAAVPVTWPYGWDPTMFPEMQVQLGRLRMKKSVVLKEYENAVIEYRLRVKKIDTAAWIGEGSGRFFWLIVTGNPSNNNVGTLNVNRYFNLSFAGDIIGTT